MKKLLLVLIALPLLGFGQGWERIFDSPSAGHKIIVDSNYYTLTAYLPDNNYRGLIRLDLIGDTIWTKKISSPVNGGLYSIRDFKRSNDGGYIISGISNYHYMHPTYSWNALLIKTNHQGDTIWTRSYDSMNSTMPLDYGECVTTTMDNGYVMGVATQGLGNSTEALLIKYNAQGDTIWKRIIPETSSVVANNSPHSIVETADSGYVFCGFYSANGYLVKTNNLGDTLWTRIIQGTNNNGYWDKLNDIKQTNDGGFIMTGFTNAIGGSGSYLDLMSSDLWLVKTDSLGIVEWSKYYGDPLQGERGNSVSQTIDGGYIITGAKYLTANGNPAWGPQEMFLFKTNQYGDSLWGKVYDTQDTLYSSGNDVKQTNDGGFVVTGVNYDTIAGRCWIIKTDSNGCVFPITWQQAISICNGDSILVGSSVYNANGNYIDTLTAENGCDSVVNTNLTIEQNTSSYDTLSVTASIVWNGISLNVSGDYSTTLINSVGCDSIVNLNLTVTTTGISDIVNNKSKLIKIIDMLGQETPYRRNTPLFYIYNDGTVEKKVVIE